MYNIVIKRKLVRRLDKLPPVVQDLFYELVEDLRHAGPVQPGWPNYS